MSENSDAFPTLAWCARPSDVHEIARTVIYDVKFWPWPDEDDENSVFALTGHRSLIVCSTRQDATQPFEIVRHWHHDEKTNWNSLCWTKDAKGKPFLCVAGSHPRAIFIYDVESGDLVRTLPGHGRPINDLQISPLSHDILASASEDYSIRIWNLNSKYDKQPCRAILGGQGHKQPLLTLDFHPNGRWLLSGAMDTAVALWGVPPMSELDAEPTEDVEPRVYPYPFFISQEIHNNFVDCVKWYGDCIISRAARGPDDGGDKKQEQNVILLWKIDGFNSAMPHPPHPPIPYPGISTRSAFPHSDRSRGFERLLTFDAKHTARFYLRFGLLDEPGMRPILVMGNEMSKFLFWDLQKYEEGEEIPEEQRAKTGRGGKKKSAKNGLDVESLGRLGGLNRDVSVASDEASAFNTTNSSHSASGAQDSSVDRSTWRSATEDPMRPIPPQHTKVPATSLPDKAARGGKVSNFASSQISWSPDGKWMVAVGDQGMMVVFHRDNAR